MTHTKLPPPYFDDGISVIYHGDARDIFPLLDAEIVVTDPPYGIEAADRFQPGAAEWAPIVGDSDTDAAAALYAASETALTARTSLKAPPSYTVHVSVMAPGVIAALFTIHKPPIMFVSGPTILSPFVL